jgi:hypothetical protein
MRHWANRSCAASANEAPFQNHIPMISIPGQYGATCDGFSRREFLRIGGAESTLVSGGAEASLAP